MKGLREGLRERDWEGGWASIGQVWTRHCAPAYLTTFIAISVP